jgi:hypothetical protein
MNFATVLGMDVLQHCLSGQRSWVSNASFKVLDAFCVSAGTTDEPRTPIISTDAVHVAPAYTRSSGVRVINFTCWVIGIVIRCGTNALGIAHQRSLALRHVHHKQKHRIADSTLCFYALQEAGELFPKRERILASLAECAGRQCNKQRRVDLATDLIQESLGCFLTADVSRGNRPIVRPLRRASASTANSLSI